MAFVNFADLITFTRASSATRVNASGVLETITSGSPRFDYDPISLEARGLLIEEQRTNLQVYSADLGNAGTWSTTAASISANAATAPDGTLTADKLVADTSSTAHRLLTTNSITVTSGAPHTISFFAKAAGESQIWVADNALVGCYFDLAAGTIGVAGSGVTAVMTPFPNGWYRCAISRLAATSAGRAIAYVARSGAVDFNGNGTDGIHLWGAQLEAGAFPTSHIPTAASQVTRSADVATISGTDFTDWFNPAEGTFLAEFDMFGTGAGHDVYTAFQNGSNYLTCSKLSGGALADQIGVTAGTQVNLQSVDAIIANTPYRDAFAYKANNCARSLNGLPVQSDVSAALPSAPTELRIGRSFTSAGTLNGHIRSLRYFPKRLPDYLLRELSA